MSFQLYDSLYFKHSTRKRNITKAQQKILLTNMENLDSHGEHLFVAIVYKYEQETGLPCMNVDIDAGSVCFNIAQCPCVLSSMLLDFTNQHIRSMNLDTERETIINTL